MDREKLRATLRDAEGVRRTAYDDKSGIMLKPGVLLVGTPTVGVGRNLSKPMSDNAINFLLEEDIDEAVATLNRLCPWWTDLTEPRQRALVEMSFQLGQTTMQDFAPTLLLIRAGQYDDAAQHLRTSTWYHQCPGRVRRLSEQLRTGLDTVKA
jgi:GH24 family phage-related lysozyme (muramidase)